MLQPSDCFESGQVKKFFPMSRKNSPRTNSYQSVNITLLGMNGVGKSATIVKYLTRRYIAEYSPFIQDKYTKSEHIEGIDYMLNVQDTCDKEDMDMKEVVRWSNILLIVYCITSRSSLYRARELLETQVALDPNRDNTVILVANKADLAHFRLVQKSEGEALAREFKCLYYESTVTEEFAIVEKLFRLSVSKYTSIHGRAHCNGTPGLLNTSTTTNGSGGGALLAAKKLSGPSTFTTLVSSGSLGRNKTQKHSASDLRASTPVKQVSGSTSQSGSTTTVNSTLGTSEFDLTLKSPSSSASLFSTGGSSSPSSAPAPSPAKKNSVAFRFFKKSSKN